MNIEELISGLGLTLAQIETLNQNIKTVEANRLKNLVTDTSKAEEGSVMTRAGLDILARGLAGEKIIYTRAAIGDSLQNGELVEVTDEQIADMTALINWRKDIPLADIRFAGNGTAVVQAVLQNFDYQEGIFFRELGLFAKIEGDAQDVLYSYRNTGAASTYVPSGQGAVILCLVLNLVTVVDNAANVYAVLDATLLYVTQSQLLEHINSFTPHPNIPQLKASVESAPSLWANDLDNHLHPITIDALTEQILSNEAEPFQRLSNRIDQTETNLANLFMQLDSLLDGGLDANLLIFEDFQDCQGVDMLKTKCLQTAGGTSDIYVESLDGILAGHFYTISDGNRSQFLRVQAVNTNDGLCNVLFDEPITKTFKWAKTYLYRTTGKIDSGLGGSGEEKETTFAPDVNWSGVASSVTKTLTLNTTQKAVANFELSGSGGFDSDGFFTLA